MRSPSATGTTTSHKCAAVPRRARIEGPQTFASLNSRLESNKEEEEGTLIDAHCLHSEVKVQGADLRRALKTIWESHCSL